MEPSKDYKGIKIQKAIFVKGIIGTDPIVVENRPQIAFVGRSNVGKSSVINKLLSKEKLAKSSSTPGKTSEINFFLINNDIYVVDLPGYGFARVGQKTSEKFRKRILWYLSESKARPNTVALILDARRGVTELDEDMIEILRDEEHPTIIIVNKSDKLKQNEQVAIIKEIKTRLESLGVYDYPVFLFSAKTGKGRDKILNYLF